MVPFANLTGTALLLSAKCPFCQKTNFHVLYHFPDKNPYEAEQLIPEREVVVPHIECCGHKKLATHMHIVVDGKIKSTSQLGSDMLPLVHGKPGEGTVAPEERDAEDGAVREFIKTDSAVLEKFYRGYFKYIYEDRKRWRTFLNELSRDEYLKGYQAAGWSFDVTYSLKVFRADMRGREGAPEEELFKFFRAVSEDLVEKHFLYIFPQGWAAALGRWMSWFGKLRCVYPVLHLPLPEELELYRTEAMAVLGKAADVTGDGSILLDRIVGLQKELSRKRKKLADMYALLRQERDHVAVLQDKIKKLGEELEKARNMRVVYNRDPGDIQKIRDLKGLVAELKSELARRLPAEEQVEPAVLEEAPLAPPARAEKEPDLSVLEGKVVGILGGWRHEQAERGDYPCVVLTDSAEKMGPEFYQVLKESDMLIVLTEHISHAAMWEAKAYAVGEGKPIYFRRGVNIWQLLWSVAAEVGS